MKLGVNIDHIAVLREARKINDPDPIDALGIVARAGGYQITIHLREDRRHIQDEDATHIVALSHLPVNIECALSDEIIDIVCRLKPHRATIVPEKRQEVTTEGGLDVIGHASSLQKAIAKLHQAGIAVSLFIDPEHAVIEASYRLGASMVELHTGTYANLYASLYSNLSRTKHAIPAYTSLSRVELEQKLEEATNALHLSADFAFSLGLEVAAGHGLNYQNVFAIANIGAISELNIGQSIVARSVFVGLERAIVEMKQCLI
ncbi:MAG: pyridoxine 5-phosphate synthase [Sulfuricurvum sp. PC08-66]|nr:MAG: pyridoxine 5-phosphate synthase [Sulfuricurvum sp. PC08-66]